MAHASNDLAARYRLWIDGVIREIQQTSAGIAVDTDDGIILYEPER